MVLPSPAGKTFLCSFSSEKTIVMNKSALLSSITKKVVMALAGLFLATFLFVHLFINLMLLLDDGGQAFTTAASFMGTNPVIRIFEQVLFAGFLLHIVFGILVSIQNRQSRPVSYSYSNRSDTSFLSKYMFHSGIVVLIFLLLHFFDFYFIKVGLVAPPPGVEAHDFYHRSILLFSNNLYASFYLISFLFLGFHLNHATQSAFQSMGWNHSRYTGALKVIGTIYAVVISGGFMAIPIFFLLFR
ncbi:succinate dehydrogenase subunit C [Chlorobium phaeobacteroides DSM 266]|uniref:Succinate dehydrogenase subunit C n=2 Tax=Chlorobium phaeobacteroides TaxID=1096 RepID=A1BCP5_CHLPD|nr:succinate dehydrogenase subunit C [Chlorobium phaeobacteroides DSM 266]